MSQIYLECGGLEAVKAVYQAAVKIAKTDHQLSEEGLIEKAVQKGLGFDEEQLAIFKQNHLDFHNKLNSQIEIIGAKPWKN